MGRFDDRPMRLTYACIAAITATTLLSVVAITSTADNSPQTAVAGRVIYVPRTVQKESTNGKQTDLVYMKLPSQETVKLTISHSMLESNISGLHWSPDASRLLLVGKAKKQSGDSSKEPGNHIPWIFDLGASMLSPVVEPREDRNYWRADWLSSGHRVLAQVVTGKKPQITWADHGAWIDKGGDFRLIVIDVKSKAEKTIWSAKYTVQYTCSPTRDEFLIWDGDYHLVSADGKTRWTIKGSDTPDRMAISPDGNRIAVYLSGRLEVIDRNTKARKVLYTKGGGVRSLVWSPNGKWIAFRESRNETASYDPPVVAFGWAVVAVNVETKNVHKFPYEVYQRGEPYTPEILGWTKDSLNLALSVPENRGRPYTNEIHDQLVICPLTGGKGTWLTDITSNRFAIDWLPR